MSAPKITRALLLMGAAGCFWAIGQSMLAHADEHGVLGSVTDTVKSIVVAGRGGDSSAGSSTTGGDSGAANATSSNRSTATGGSGGNSGSVGSAKLTNKATSGNSWTGSKTMSGNGGNSTALAEVVGLLV